MRSNISASFRAADINRGRYRFEPVTDKVIRYGLGAVKGTGQQAIEAIIAAREGPWRGAGAARGPFKSLFDFACAWTGQRINKRTVEALIKSRRLRRAQLNRAALVASMIDRAFDFAAAQIANANQGGLFDMMGEDAVGSSTQEPIWWTPRPLGHQGTRLMQEKRRSAFTSRAICSTRCAGRGAALYAHADCRAGRQPRAQVLAGIVSDSRQINGQRGAGAVQDRRQVGGDRGLGGRGGDRRQRRP